jgi:energy-coupling factor transport system permease protein
MRLEIYVPRASPVHALHPATKLALLVLGIVAPFLTPSAAAQVLALAAVLAAAGAARVLREVLGPWRLLLFLFAITLVLWGVTSAGWVASLAYSVRVTAIFILGLVFLATTRIEETIEALEIARVPYRLAFALGLAFRLVPLFLASAASIVEAQRSRGLEVHKGSIGERLRNYVPILVPIFMTSLRNADRMAMALEARGFAAGGQRTRLRRRRFRAADVLALGIGVAFLALYVAFREGALSLVPA